MCAFTDCCIWFCVLVQLYAALDVDLRERVEVLMATLDLTQNDIGDEGVKAIAESEIFSNLRTLNLKSNRIGDDGAGYLANSKTLKNLRSMQLVVNDLSEEGEKLLRNSTALVSLSSLKFRV